MGAFAQTNEGDVTPNTDGSKCVDTDVFCDYLTSTCEENRDDVSNTNSHIIKSSCNPKPVMEGWTYKAHSLKTG